MSQTVRIQKPYGWPSDGRATFTKVDGVVIGRHPDRDPVQLLDGKWVPIEKVNGREVRA